MGGKGSGGARVGAGRKPKDTALGALTGSRRVASRQRRNQTATEPNNQTPAEQSADGEGTAPPPPEVPSPPDLPIPPTPGNLTLDELAVWNELAPIAAREGTLTDTTVVAMRDLCEAIVLKRKLLRTVDTDGLVVLTRQGTRAAHPLLAQFRGLMQRVEGAMVRFKLAPMGKELGQPTEQPADPFAEFDEPASETAH